MASVNLFNLPIYFTKILLLSLEEFLGVLHHKSDHHHGDRKDHQRCQRHPHIDAEHHHKHTDQGGGRGDQLGNTLVQTGLKGIHIVCHSGKDLTCGPALKIFQRETVDLLGNILS